MFLRAKVRRKDGKQHRYFSVVENRRVGRNKTAQRTVLYLGEINDSQESAWRNTLEVFDERRQQYTTLSLFPEDRVFPAETANTLQVKLNWNCRSSGRRSYPARCNAKPCLGRKSCGCWW
jgi:hypothetical protein